MAYLARRWHPQRIYFVHLRPSYEVPEAMKKYLPHGEVPTRESIRVELEALVQPHFTAQEDIVCEVLRPIADGVALLRWKGRIPTLVSRGSLPYG